MAAFLECIHQLQTELGPDARQEDGTAQQKVADIIADAILALPNPVGEKVREKIFKHYKSGTASELLCAHPGDDKRAGLGWQDILGRQQEWITSPERFFDEPKPLNVALYLKAWSVRGKYGLLAAIKFRLIAGELHRCRTTWGARASKFREAVREAAYARTKTGNRFEAELHNKDFSEWNSYGRTSVYLSENFEPGTIIALAETLDSTYQKASTGDRAGENELFRDACSQAVREKARQFAQLEIALRGYLSNLCEKFKVSTAAS
ncbi:hypothetical protein CCHR01_13101 [Colletotrichum chrysophilum]|uniref:Uncharacterized protein n=1 Tax=Colletotrichum chrysophilum TaxID=1836956 RepID=A0AAD9AB60_9PEZI|nr:hypothetical protein CCHR01_13101 [Colletotrichum chrysophilum]